MYAYFKMPWCFTDQPGRWCAIFLLGPMLLHMANRLEVSCSSNEVIASHIRILAIVFIVYELFWILGRPPKQVCFK